MGDIAAGPGRGWLPIGIDIDPAMPFADGGSVRWIEVKDDPLADPFLAHAINRLRETVPPARELDTSCAVLIALAQSAPPVAPAGFIFHVSRCGSTLIANAMKTISDAIVIAEPYQATKLLLPPGGEQSTFAEKRWTERRDALLRAMFAVFAHYRTGDPQPLIVKFPSIDILHIKTLQSLWPDTPILVVVRDPIEVVVASLAGGIWMDLKPDAARSMEILGFDGSAMPDADHCARALDAYQRAALDALDDRCKVVDYGQLNAQTMRTIANFFGQHIDNLDALEQTMTRYSKSADGQIRFRDDRLSKQRGADYVVRAAASRWAQNSYTELRKRSS